jgi:hypothetical protein
MTGAVYYTMHVFKIYFPLPYSKRGLWNSIETNGLGSLRAENEVRFNSNY